jgi:hypothetical protein
MPNDNFADLAKDYVLWQSQKAGDVDLMLKRTDTNSRTNEALGRWRNALTNITANWRGNYKNMWAEAPIALEKSYLNLDAFGRKQAIELATGIAKASIPGGPGDPKKPGGLLGGIFGK